MSKRCCPLSIQVPTFAELTSPHYQRRLWSAIGNLSISRRSLLDEIANAFRDYRGTIRYPGGARYTVPDIDEVFGGDPDCRWFSYYLEANEEGTGPRRRVRKTQRLELLALFCLIRYPSPCTPDDGCNKRLRLGWKTENGTKSTPGVLGSS